MTSLATTLNEKEKDHLFSYLRIHESNSIGWLNGIHIQCNNVASHFGKIIFSSMNTVYLPRENSFLSYILLKEVPIIVYMRAKSDMNSKYHRK